MREILFRGKRKDNGEWVKGNLFVDEKGEKYEILVGYVNYRIAWEVIPETVGQFTGLTDNSENRKKIFEGDVVKIKIGDLRKIGAVKYSERAGRVGIIEPDKNWNFSFMQQPLIKMYDIEIIGKIFDSPELIVEKALGKDKDVLSKNE